jgi:hypothetical protein
VKYTASSTHWRSLVASRKLAATGAVVTALALAAPAGSPGTPPVGSCPSPFVTRTLDFFEDPAFAAPINKNGDDILCTRDFPAVNGKPGGNVIDNTKQGP